VPLQVELVSADQRVWSGEASMIVAKTTEGDIGVLPGHAPVLAVLGAG
jgi:F-type H+-transporting ATPase subunit epsilon